MRKYIYFWFFVLMTVNDHSWAYGSSSSSKACAKPEFNHFIPTENATVAAGSDFSFFASANSYPNTIKVIVKDLPVTVKVTPRNDGVFQVTGTLPVSLKEVYARIVITANAQNNCIGEGGWLIKISDQ